jgi:hypothetical protein
MEIFVNTGSPGKLQEHLGVEIFFSGKQFGSIGDILHSCGLELKNYQTFCRDYGDGYS